MAVNSRDSLKDYCLRKLGAPVLQINVDDDQVEDRIDDALHMFQEYHSDGLVKKYLALQLTATDIARTKLPIPENVYSVIKILPIPSNSSSNMNISYTAAMSDILDGMRMMNQVEGGGLYRYTLIEQHLSLVNQFFSREKLIRFNRYQNFLEMDTDWSQLIEGDYVVVECWAAIDMDEYERTWGDQWLKQYATALIKQQWGTNLIKYQGFQLPSGIVMDGTKIYDDATSEIADLIEKLENTYQYPIDFCMG